MPALQQSVKPGCVPPVDRLLFITLSFFVYTHNKKRRNDEKNQEKPGSKKVNGKQEYASRKF
jgi:hypothetical protein